MIEKRKVTMLKGLKESNSIMSQQMEILIKSNYFKKEPSRNLEVKISHWNKNLLEWVAYYHSWTGRRKNQNLKIILIELSKQGTVRKKNEEKLTEFHRPVRYHQAYQHT